MSEDTRRAIQHAYKLLSYRQRSVKELAERLQRKGFSTTVVREAIEHLKSNRYLDDSVLALSLRRNAEEVKLLGAVGARQYLMQKGIPRETAEEVLADYDELATARRLINRKLKIVKDCPETVLRRKLSGFLKRRGYSTDTIRKSLKF
jgi:regulatory protein